MQFTVKTLQIFSKFKPNWLWNLLKIMSKLQNKYFQVHFRINKNTRSTINFIIIGSTQGQIEWIDLMAPAGTSWHCKYEFFSGPDWKIIGGLEAGLSQVANVVNNGDKVVLNFPIEVQFKSTNPYGWPQIILSVYRNMQLGGYGRAHMPLKPGSHKLNVHLSKPQASSLLGYIGSFFGYQPELLQPTMLATTAGNNLIRMESAGQAHLTVNVVTQEFQSLGYDVGKIKD